MPSELSAMQEQLWDLITAPEGVAAALRDPAIPRLETWIAEGQGSSRSSLNAVERLDVYANMYFYRLLDVLSADYKKISTQVGAAAFHNLITDYLLAHPSRSPSLRDAGARLPAFLRAHPLSAQHPGLPDLAAIERAWVEVFDRENVSVLEREHLAALPPEAWSDLRLRAIPALRILQLDHNAQELFAAMERGEPAAWKSQPATVVIWRRDLQVWMRPLSTNEIPLFEMLQAGCTFAAVCEFLRELSGSDELAAQRSLEALQGWLEAGLLLA